MKQHFLRNLLAVIGLCVLAMQSWDVVAQDAPSWILDYTKVVVDKTDGAGEGGLRSYGPNQLDFILFDYSATTRYEGTPKVNGEKIVDPKNTREYYEQIERANSQSGTVRIEVPEKKTDVHKKIHTLTATWGSPAEKVEIGKENMLTIDHELKYDGIDFDKAERRFAFTEQIAKQASALYGGYDYLDFTQVMTVQILPEVSKYNYDYVVKAIQGNSSVEKIEKALKKYDEAAQKEYAKYGSSYTWLRLCALIGDCSEDAEPCGRGRFRCKEPGWNMSLLLTKKSVMVVKVWTHIDYSECLTGRTPIKWEKKPCTVVQYFVYLCSDGRTAYVTSEASETPGEDGGTSLPPWVYIPPLVLIPPYIIIKNRQKKNKDAPKAVKGKGKQPKEEKPKEEPKKKEELKKKPSSYKMYLYKEFGDTLQVNGEPQFVGARIEEITADGQRLERPDLTRLIEITEGENIKILATGTRGKYRCAKICVPNAPKDSNSGIVYFTFESSSGGLRKKYIIKIAEPKVVFGQENLTLPACYDEVVRLPFCIDGMEEAEVSAMITGSRDPSKPDYTVEVEYNAEQNLYYAVINERLKEKKGPAGSCDFYTLHVKATKGNAVAAAELPLYRYVMGLRIEMLGNVGCYLEEWDPAKHLAKRPEPSADGKYYVPAETKVNVKLYDYDMETHSLHVWSPGLNRQGEPAGDTPVLTGYRLIPAEENREALIKRLHITCDVRDQTSKSDTGTGRLCILSCQAAVLDAPTRLNAVLELTAQSGDHTYTATHDVRLLSQPVRPYTAECDKEDERIYNGLVNIKDNIWSKGWYQNLFPLVHLIDIVIDGYDLEFGYDKNQIKTIQEVYLGFLDGSVTGANAEPETISLGDYVRMYIGAFAQTTTDVKKFNDSIPGMLTRFTLGFVTLGGSEVVYESFDLVAYSVQMGQGVVEAAKNEENRALAILTVGAKIMLEEGGSRLMQAGAQKALNSKPMVEARNKVMKKGEELLNKGKDFFSGKRAAVTTKGAKQAAQAAENAKKMSQSIERMTEGKKMTPDELEMQKAFEHNQVIAKENIDNLHAAIELCEWNPTPANLKLKNELVIKCQQSKSTIYYMQNYADVEMDSVRAEFNKVMKGFHDKAYDETAYILAQRYGITPGEVKRFKATAADMKKVVDGKKVPVDSDTTLYFKDSEGNIRYFNEREVQDIYNRKLYEATQGVAPTDQVYADRLSQKVDSTIIEDVVDNPESYAGDVYRMIKKDLHKDALTNPQKVADAIKYKLTHWHKQKQTLLEQAVNVTDELEKKAILGRADECGREGYRQIVKIYDSCLNLRDIERSAINNGPQFTDKMRSVVEILRGASDPVKPKSLVKVEQELAAVGMTMEKVADEFSSFVFKIG